MLSHLMDVTGRGGFIFVLGGVWEGERWMGDGVGGCGGGGRNFESPCGARRFGLVVLTREQRILRVSELVW